jgi:ABC-type amino acid transport substrate-binding protein
MGTRGEIEAALSAHPAVAIDTLALPELRVTGWPLGMAVKADSAALAEALGNALADLQRAGDLARIFEANGVRHRLP